MTLLDDTYRLLDAARDDLSLREISEESGVNYHWLSKFAQRAYTDPRIRSVQQLHKWLSSEKRAAA